MPTGSGDRCGASARAERARRICVAAAVAMAVPFATVALVPAGPAGVEGAVVGAGPPNIIVVMTDDQEARSMWAMPKTRKRLRRHGTTFRSSFVTYPLCCPSRATFLTGRYAHNHGVLDNEAPDGGAGVFDDSNTVAVALRNSGYRTGFIGKYLNGYPALAKQDLGFRPPGWDRWFAITKAQMFRWALNDNGRIRRFKERPRDYQTDVLARIAQRFIKTSAQRPRPFFLAVMTHAPHGEKPQRGKHPNPRPAPRHLGASKRKPFKKRFRPPPSFNEVDVSDKPESIQRLARFGPAQRRAIRLRFRSRSESLMAVDDLISGLIDTLRSSRSLANTLIVFTSDNGMMLGEHRVPFAKRWLYEESIRVPLIIRGPGFPAGAVRDQVVTNVDLAPTMLDSAGLLDQANPPLDFDGISLLGPAADPEVASSRAILLENLKASDRFAGVRVPGWAYLEHGPGAEELYDMAADRFQLESVHAVPEHGPIKGQLKSLLETMRNCGGNSGPASCYQEVRE